MTPGTFQALSDVWELSFGSWTDKIPSPPGTDSAGREADTSQSAARTAMLRGQSSKAEGRGVVGNRVNSKASLRS